LLDAHQAIVHVLRDRRAHPREVCGVLTSLRVKVDVETSNERLLDL